MGLTVWLAVRRRRCHITREPPRRAHAVRGGRDRLFRRPHPLRREARGPARCCAAPTSRARRAAVSLGRPGLGDSHADAGVVLTAVRAEPPLAGRRHGLSGGSTAGPLFAFPYLAGGLLPGALPARPWSSGCREPRSPCRPTCRASRDHSRRRCVTLNSRSTSCCLAQRPALPRLLSLQPEVRRDRHRLCCSSAIPSPMA